MYKEIIELLRLDNFSTDLYGIMGETPYAKVLKIPEQIPFDFMHLVLQGHVKWIIHHYFYSKGGDCDICKYNISGVFSSFKLEITNYLSFFIQWCSNQWIFHF